MDIWRPFTGRAARAAPSTTPYSTADTLFIASLNQLKDLALSYYISQPSAACSILWHTSLLYIANTVLRKSYTLSDRETFLQLCLESYTNLAKSYPLAIGFLQGVLYLAIQTEIITPAKVAQQVKLIQAHRGYAAQGTKSAHILDLSLALTDQEAALVESLAERLDTIVVNQDFEATQSPPT